MNALDTRKSLQELEGRDWGEATYDSYLVSECHRLRRVPLSDFTPESLRIMIGQQIGLPYLVPLALDVLRADPLVHCDYFAGDLLASVLRAESAFWLQYPDLHREASEIHQFALLSFGALELLHAKTSRDAIADAYAHFVRSAGTAA